MAPWNCHYSYPCKSLMLIFWSAEPLSKFCYTIFWADADLLFVWFRSYYCISPQILVNKLIFLNISFLNYLYVKLLLCYFLKIWIPYEHWHYCILFCSSDFRFWPEFYKILLILRKHPTIFSFAFIVNKIIQNCKDYCFTDIKKVNELNHCLIVEQYLGSWTFAVFVR